MTQRVTFEEACEIGASFFTTSALQACVKPEDILKLADARREALVVVGWTTAELMEESMRRVEQRIAALRAMER